jgi:predicted MFS family arabinose efflux permease
MQWRPLLENSKVRNVVVMNGFYWVALSGAQMTLLPLILTDPSGLALSPTSVGEIYMGMSMVQVFGNPTMAKYIDKIGKVPGIVTGCSILSASMFTLPFCTEMDQVAYTLGFWALGSTMLSTAPTAFISDHVPDDQRAQAIALLRTAGDVGLLVGASSTGAVADMFNMNVAVHSSASLLLLATGWFTARRLADWHQSKHIFK